VTDVCIRWVSSPLASQQTYSTLRIDSTSYTCNVCEHAHPKMTSKCTTILTMWCAHYVKHRIPQSDFPIVGEKAHTYSCQDIVPNIQQYCGLRHSKGNIAKRLYVWTEVGVAKWSPPYSATTSSSVMSVNALPATLTKWNFVFICVDIPSEKHASSSRIYSLNVAPRQRPIFWICVSEKPAKNSAFAPPLRRECASIQSIEMPFAVG
jgi:hypothetical protein